jgi:hypothetical protein
VLAWRSYCSRRRIHLSNYFGTRQSKLDYSLPTPPLIFSLEDCQNANGLISTSNQSVILTSGKGLACPSAPPSRSLPDLSNVPFQPLLLFLSSDLPCFGSVPPFFPLNTNLVTTTPSTTAICLRPRPPFSQHITRLLISHRPGAPLYPQERACGSVPAGGILVWLEMTRYR